MTAMMIAAISHQGKSRFPAAAAAGAITSPPGAKERAELQSPLEGSSTDGPAGTPFGNREGGEA
jgi:hypothetical protein